MVYMAVLATWPATYPQINPMGSTEGVNFASTILSDAITPVWATWPAEMVRYDFLRLSHNSVSFANRTVRSGNGSR